MDIKRAIMHTPKISLCIQLITKPTLPCFCATVKSVTRCTLNYLAIIVYATYIIAYLYVYRYTTAYMYILLHPHFPRAVIKILNWFAAANQLLQQNFETCRPAQSSTLSNVECCVDELSGARNYQVFLTWIIRTRSFIMKTIGGKISTYIQRI